MQPSCVSRGPAARLRLPRAHRMSALEDDDVGGRAEGSSVPSTPLLASEASVGASSGEESEEDEYQSLEELTGTGTTRPTGTKSKAHRPDAAAHKKKKKKGNHSGERRLATGGALRSTRRPAATRSHHHQLTRRPPPPARPPTCPLPPSPPPALRPQTRPKRTRSRPSRRGSKARTVPSSAREWRSPRRRCEQRGQT